MYIYLYIYTYIYVGGLEVGTRCPGGGCGVISRWPRHRNRARVYVPVCLPSKQGDAKQGDAHSGTSGIQRVKPIPPPPASTASRLVREVTYICKDI